MYQLKGTINSDHAAALEKELLTVLPKELDASQLEYISSAGLCALLTLVKTVGDVTIENVSGEVYEIFQVTGFTEILTVRKRLKEIQIDEAKLLGAYQLMSLTPKKNPDVAMRYLGLTTEEALRMWDLFIRDYLGTEDDKAIAEIEESLKSYALIRNIGGVVFSDVIPEDKRRPFSSFLIKDLLGSMEKADRIIKAV